MTYKAMYKYELAAKAEVSTDTIRKWLKENETVLYSFGYRKKDKLLSPKTVGFLCEKYGIVLE